MYLNTSKQTHSNVRCWFGWSKKSSSTHIILFPSLGWYFDQGIGYKQLIFLEQVFIVGIYLVGQLLKNITSRQHVLVEMGKNKKKIKTLNCSYSKKILK